MDHIHASEMTKWQVAGNYSIEDRYTPGYVFVPRTPACVCKLFRAMHKSSNDKPSHALVHVKGDECMLVPLRPMYPGEEVTFDYFAGDQDTDNAGAGTQPNRNPNPQS